MPAVSRRKRGFTLLELIMVVAIIAIIAVIAIPGVIHARKSANESTSIEALKAIATAEALFKEGDKERDGILDYGMLSELSNTTLIDGVLGQGTSKGYVFAATYSVVSSEYLWFATANPLSPQNSGDRYFETNQSGVVYYTTGAKLPLDNTLCLPATGTFPIGK